MYSFGAREGEERGIAEVDLLQAAAVPGLDRMPLVSALNDLKNELLYLHHTGRRYRFETQANLNKLIDEALKNFTADDVMARIKSTLETELAGVRGAVVWPIDSDRVNDRVPMLQVVYLPFEWSEASNRSELDTKLMHWLEFCGSSRREYKNGLAFAIPNYSGADSLRSAARELLAMESIKREQRKHLAAEQVQELDERIRASTERIKRGVVAVYDQTAVPEPAQNSGTPYKWRYLELQSQRSTAPRACDGCVDRHLSAVRPCHTGEADRARRSPTGPGSGDRADHERVLLVPQLRPPHLGRCRA